MVEKKSWEEFRNSGLILIINQFLHIFGWAIVLELDGEEVQTVYPARVKFRGFSEASTEKAYKKVTQYMADNISGLLEDVDIS